MKSYAILRCGIECTKCGSWVEFEYSYDRSVNYAAVNDTRHQRPAGGECDLSESDIDQGIEMRATEGPERDQGKPHPAVMLECHAGHRWNTEQVQE